MFILRHVNKWRMISLMVSLWFNRGLMGIFWSGSCYLVVFWLFCLAVFLHQWSLFIDWSFYSNKQTQNVCICIWQYEICIAESLGGYLYPFLCFIFILKTKGFVFCMQKFTEEVNNVHFPRWWSHPTNGWNSSLLFIISWLTGQFPVLLANKKIL